MITMIWAESFNGVIGLENKIPWEKHKEDMKYFRMKTVGNVVVMGRKTFESLGSKPLPKRENIVLTRDKTYQAEDGVFVENDYKRILEIAETQNVFIIGGREIYALFMPYASRIYKTVINGIYYGDTKAPFVDMTEWKQTTSPLLGEGTDDVPYFLVELTRIRSKTMKLAAYHYHTRGWDFIQQGDSLEEVTEAVEKWIKENVDEPSHYRRWISSKNCVYTIDYGSYIKFIKLFWEYPI